MKYNKLVRDKIPQIIKEKGQTVVTHTATDEEYWSKLKEKLREEVQEFLEDENSEEIADILEVLYAICDFKNITREKIESLRLEKNKKRGGFREKIILEETT